MGFRSPTVFIDRNYDDSPDDEPPWARRRRWPGDPIWEATCEYGDHADRAAFDDVDDAIAWGRARAERVLVRLGADNAAVYAAGSEPTAIRGKPLPAWPPDTWPDYLGPGSETRRWPFL